MPSVKCNLCAFSYRYQSYYLIYCTYIKYYASLMLQWQEKDYICLEQTQYLDNFYLWLAESIDVEWETQKVSLTNGAILFWRFCFFVKNMFYLLCCILAILNALTESLAMSFGYCIKSLIEFVTNLCPAYLLIIKYSYYFPWYMILILFLNLLWVWKL